MDSKGRLGSVLGVSAGVEDDEVADEEDADDLALVFTVLLQ